MVEVDAEVLAAWAGGDRGAGDDFVRRHFDLVWRYFRGRVDDGIDDLIQETFLRCQTWQARVAAADSPRAYVLAIARSVLVARLSRHRAFDPATSSIAASIPSPSAVVAEGERFARLTAHLRALPFELQEILELYYWEHVRGRELASALEIPEGSMRTRLRRARQALRERYAVDDAARAQGRGRSVP
jgi:RNA polymerase sigma-70 factor (ECF subfamily)